MICYSRNYTLNCITCTIHNFMITHRPAHSSVMKIEGTVMGLVISNYDSVEKDNVIGICIVPCNTIPQFTDVSELQMSPMRLSLPVFHIRSSNLLQELVTRHQRSDEVASVLYTTLVKKFRVSL